MSLQIKVKRLHASAVLPEYQTEGAMAFDLELLREGNIDHYTIPPGRSMAFRTGLAFEIPPGFGMFIYSRSGHGFKNGVRLGNATGLIDSDYRGELMVKLHNDDPTHPFTIRPGARIAQGVVMPIPHCAFQWAEDISHTARGSNGFGSTDLGIKPPTDTQIKGADSVMGAL